MATSTETQSAVPNRPEAGAAAAESDKKKARPKEKESARDTIESILFAFVLAFLFRTFEAEAFVIPTGSMAPTLYGRHKESYCTGCGHKIVVGASNEMDAKTNLLMDDVRLESAVCPNCGLENRQMKQELAFNGDRILVNKYPYEFGDPDRWDVFVFKYPSEPETNYIKRLVGLPGETLRIRRGNLFSVDGNEEWILRKDPGKQQAIQIPVYDDSHPPRELIEQGWPERWASMKQSGGESMGGWRDDPQSWNIDRESRRYSVQAEGNDARWLRYRHIPSRPSDWEAASEGRPLAPKPRLIGDLCGYNEVVGTRRPPFEALAADDVDFGAFWVPDLTVDFEIEITSLEGQPELILELCEGARRYRCRIDPDNGSAELEEVDSQQGDRVIPLAKGTTSLKGTGRYEISFANVDDRLCLWVDGSLVDFGDGALVDSGPATGRPSPTQQDFTPVGIGIRGMTATVGNLLLKRDIYYRSISPENDWQQPEVLHTLGQRMSDPEAWADAYQKFGDELMVRTISIPEDHFLAFGDNSPQSNDSRLWDPRLSTVPREYLVGKAFWIYWPHGVPFLNGGRGFPVTYNRTNRGRKVEDYPHYTVPFYPQVQRMKRIR